MNKINEINKVDEFIDMKIKLDLIYEKINNNCFTDYILIKNFNIPNLECVVCNISTLHKLNCNHSLCKSCFHNWNINCIMNSILTTCPICRIIIN
jgi:hypothetical protein